MEEELKVTCDKIRKDIHAISNTTKYLMCHSDLKGEQAYVGQHCEMRANIMLAYRHLEDARMRIGKILQAASDGVSIFDEN